MLKVALVSGSWPPESCGVGDYADRLATTLGELGVDATRLGGTSKGRGQRGTVTSVLTRRFDVVHIQYPTVGDGRSVVPAILPLVTGRAASVVTVHEFSSFNKWRRPWFSTFAHGVDARLFTNSMEQQAFKEKMQPSRGIDRVVPLGSSIEKGSSVKIPGTVCRFGLLRPHAGVEAFLDFAELAQSLPHIKAVLVGSSTADDRSFAEEAVRRANRLGVELHLDLPPRSVAEVLAAQQFAYLPFPDGASPKRSSMLAVQQNDIIVLTTHSGLTPPGMRACTLEAVSPSAALAIVEAAMRSPAHLDHLTARATTTPPTDWNAIGREHIGLYEDLRKKGRRGRAASNRTGLVGPSSRTRNG